MGILSRLDDGRKILRIAETYKANVRNIREEVFGAIDRGENKVAMKQDIAKIFSKVTMIQTTNDTETLKV